MKHPAPPPPPSRRVAGEQRQRVDPGTGDPFAARAMGQLVFSLVLADSGGDTAAGSAIGPTRERWAGAYLSCPDLCALLPLPVPEPDPMTNAIPTIDIEALSSPDATARRQVASSIGRACRDIGFFVIRGHGVADRVVERTFAASRELFALPDEVKQSLAVAARGHHRGYVGPIRKTRRDKAAPDIKEAFSLIWTDGTTRPPNVWPPIPGWREEVQLYFDSLLRVGRVLHRAFALDLGLEESWFDDKIDCPLATLRMFRYPAAWGAPTTTTPASPNAGIHTDYGNLTLVAAGDVGRLQVQGRDGQWIEVPALEGAFVCNVGDCLMRWTNDVYVSTPHRVLPPQRERYSIVVFFDANPDALVSALPGCVPAGAVPRHAPVLAADYLNQHFATTYGG